MRFAQPLITRLSSNSILVQVASVHAIQHYKTQPVQASSLLPWKRHDVIITKTNQIGPIPPFDIRVLTFDIFQAVDAMI
jgi:hypothetical protein